jgi:hypothetical protein
MDPRVSCVLAGSSSGSAKPLPDVFRAVDADVLSVVPFGPEMRMFSPCQGVSGASLLMVNWA